MQPGPVNRDRVRVTSGRYGVPEGAEGRAVGSPYRGEIAVDFAGVAYPSRRWIPVEKLEVVSS